MPTRYDEEDEQPDRGEGDREISLGTGTVLAIFLALALVCSLFFGLGYSMGRKSAPSSPATASSLPVPSALSSSGTDKPSPGSPASARTASSLRPDLQVAQPVDRSSEANSSPESTSDALPAPRSPARDRSSAPKPPSATETSSPLPPSGVATGGAQIFVQVAAVSRKEDAELLLAALRKRGYSGLLRPQTQDKLLHVQVGPFSTRKDAEEMRQRLMTDGYNPIIK